jgi:hypothetical protein
MIRIDRFNGVLREHPGRDQDEEKDNTESGKFHLVVNPTLTGSITLTGSEKLSCR